LEHNNEWKRHSTKQVFPLEVQPKSMPVKGQNELAGENLEKLT